MVNCCYHLHVYRPRHEFELNLNLNPAETINRELWPSLEIVYNPDNPVIRCDIIYACVN